MHHYKSIHALACNLECAKSFQSDRRMGLIYGPYCFSNGEFALNWEQASRRAFFCAYCGSKAKLEIYSNGSWIEVTPDIFRSWCGKRKMDGKRYIGKRYILGTFQTIPETQAIED